MASRRSPSFAGGSKPLFAPTNALCEPLGDHLDRWLLPPAPEAHAHAPGRASWQPIVRAWRAGPQAAALVQAVQARQAQGACIYPARVLHALDLTSLDRVRVIILGQDPYHGPDQAQGLAFSVSKGHPIPPSLRNILQEIHRDLGPAGAQAQGGDLSDWARQGVLLLNTCLTVEDGQPASHARLGWENLTDRLIAEAARQAVSSGRPLVAMLWGQPAQRRREVLLHAAGAGRLLVLQANHPSPLSARRPPVPFIGCGHFSQARDFLAAWAPGDPPIAW